VVEPVSVPLLRSDGVLLTLVLYTDGLVERRGESIDAGIARLAGAPVRPEPDLDRSCDHLLQQVGPAEPLDDIAIVAVRRHPDGAGRAG
jgi:hypothetical protein